MHSAAPFDDPAWPDEIRAASEARFAEAGQVLARTGTQPRFMFHVQQGEV